MIRAESEVLMALGEQIPGMFPQPVMTTGGDFSVIAGMEKKMTVRLLGWVEGDLMTHARHTSEMMYSLGRLLGRLDSVLLQHSSIVIQGRKTDWDLQHLSDLKPLLSGIPDAALRKKVHYFMLQFREEAVEVLPVLRHSVIHNDANDWNVLVKDGRVAGIIDFGDMVYAPLIQELAVCITYAMFDKEEPLPWASEVLKGYHEVLPLEARELGVLYYLVAGRLCMSLMHSARAAGDSPGNAYLGVSERQAKDLLDKWLLINPRKAGDAFRDACGMKPLEQAPVSDLMGKRNLHISRSQSVSYRQPVWMERAAFQYMYDAYGNTFLDAYNNIPHVGHEHPRVVEAGQRQMAKLNTNTRYLYDILGDYAEKLVRKFPAPLKKVFFVNSGSAASDLAIRMARTHTGHRDVMVLEHGYHGNTQLGIDISHYKFGGAGGRGLEDYILKVPIPDTYKGRFTIDDGTAGKAYAEIAEEILLESGGETSAFIAEPVVGCAGQVPLAKGYLESLYPVVRKKGGVCISDEVQTGFGRMGSVFWGFELQGVIPDIVVLGKPMGNGHPLAAVVTTDEIARSFDNGMEFFSSFGGNPVSCAIGLAVLEVIEEEGLQANAFETGTCFQDHLSKLMDEFPCIGDVRGQGLFLGVEFVKDRLPNKPDRELAGLVKNKLRERFILVSTDGPDDNVIKMKPPLCFSKENAREVVENMRTILRSVL